MYFFRKMIAVLLGSILIGTGVNFFLVPHQLIEGGMIGIGLLANYYLGLSPGVVVMCASLPIYLLIFLIDRPLFYHSFHGMLLSSFFIDFLSPLREYNPLAVPASAILGGGLIGSGVGWMLGYGTNTGGTDLLAQFLARRYEIPVALLIFLIDGVIVGCSFELAGPYKFVYSLVTIAAVAISTHLVCRFVQNSYYAPYQIIGPLGKGSASLWRK
ncbi:YitT family protein [Brevibacillus fulvus]|uniref:Uncharacterized membrane-anchored protein YitT (DUF2179 family) n=1 Tax=Brevibacillus fulvus TaxID=1125967 RepID=A0A938Y0H7_9BACL|nr:YitT family protein [Brevibacillus fulvus]MBM7590938.1 uncharacterized membrane-anchored protein YitT (DUF2179 family) [Brevibacillus fulvus]